MKNRGDLRSANLGGRPANEFKLACQAALKRADGVGFAERLVKGEEVDYYVVDKELVPGPPRLAMRMEAAKWLADRGHGKATVHVEVAPSSPDALLTGEEVLQRVAQALPVVLRAISGDARVTLLASIQQTEVVMEEK